METTETKRAVLKVRIYERLALISDDALLKQVLALVEDANVSLPPVSDAEFRKEFPRMTVAELEASVDEALEDVRAGRVYTPEEVDKYLDQRYGDAA